MKPISNRLEYARLQAATASELQRLGRDPHIARYLLDGEEIPDDWARLERVRSDTLFAHAGLGLWLVRERGGAEWIGFAGFRVFDEIGEEPQLLYALREPLVGRGYATEIAGALIAFARSGGHRRIVSAVDAPNHASRRVLEKVGFVATGAVPGAFGSIVLYALENDSSPT